MKIEGQENSNERSLTTKRIICQELDQLELNKLIGSRTAEGWNPKGRTATS